MYRVEFVRQFCQWQQWLEATRILNLDLQTELESARELILDLQAESAKKSEELQGVEAAENVDRESLQLKDQGEQSTSRCTTANTRVN